MTETVGLDADNLALRPWDYPGKLPSHSGLLHEGVFRRLSPRQGRRLGQAGVEFRTERRWDTLNYALLFSNVAAVDNRYLVVAIGSNASPAVMRRKFANENVDTVLPFVKARVTGLRVGHSAHISTPGYVAATPILEPGSETSVLVSLLDHEQIECLDRTEPNYVRRYVAADMCRLQLDGGERPSSFLLYVSKWGALAPPKAAPLALKRQEEIFAELRRGCAAFSRLVGSDGDYKAVMSRLAADPNSRRTAREAFRAAGWASPGGFEELEQGNEHGRYGLVASRWSDEEPHAVAGDALVCLPTADALERHGEQCVTLHPIEFERRGSPSHVGVQSVSGPRLPPVPARVTTSDTQPLGTVAVDQVLRNALGVEVQESVLLEPIRVTTTPLADLLLSRPHYSMLRVQPADLATVEQNVGLLSPIGLSILGVESGDEIVIQGAPDDSGRVRETRMLAYAAPDEITDRRDRLSGGALHSRFPSARDALGVYPDLPWLFLDSASRAELGIYGQKLSVVRARASRRFQLTREFRELLLLLALAFIGVAAVVESSVMRILLLCVLLVGTATVVRSRLKNRLEFER